MPHIVEPHEKIYHYVNCYHCKRNIAYENTDLKTKEFTVYTDLYDEVCIKNYIICPACEKIIYTN